MFEADGDHENVGEHGTFLGSRLVRRGGVDNARLAVPLLQRALAASDHLPARSADNAIRMEALAGLGNAYIDLDEFDSAIATISQSVADMQERGEAGGIVGALRNRGESVKCPCPHTFSALCGMYKRQLALLLLVPEKGPVEFTVVVYSMLLVL